MPTARQAHILDRLQAHLRAAHHADWRVEGEGEGLIGPGSVGVRITDHAGLPASHVDIGFAINRERADAAVIWDCASGMGQPLEAALDRAVKTWAEFTLPVILELLDGRGHHAEHLPADDPIGLAGWHCIHGPILGVGSAEQAGTLQQWVVDHPLLPALGSELAAALDRPNLNGIKLVFGSETAEVRINGRAHEALSQRLLALPWPRTAGAAFVRVFVLAVHPVPG